MKKLLGSVRWKWRRLLQHLGLACHCGSGSHPRRCKKHPWAFRQHVFDLNLESLFGYIDDLEKRIEKFETMFSIGDDE